MAEEEGEAPDPDKLCFVVGPIGAEDSPHRLRHLERVQAQSFVDALLAMPRDDGDFPRRHVRMPDPDL